MKAFTISCITVLLCVSATGCTKRAQEETASAKASEVHSSQPATPKSKERQGIAPQTHMTLAEHERLIAALADEFPFRPIRSWKGLKFVFLEKTPSSRKYGYQGFETEASEHKRPSYEECVGRIATVVEIREEGDVPKVTFRMDDKGQTYTANVLTDSIDDLAPVEDIEKARVRWAGKTLWLRRSAWTFNEATDQFGTLPVKRFDPVTVIRVVSGWYEHEPIRFVVRSASGDEGFVDCQLSGTNTSDTFRKWSHFQQKFFLEDPRKLYPWDEGTWKALAEGHVLVGMTADKARLSWGDPSGVSRTTTAVGTTEHWSYGDEGKRSLTLIDGKVAVIQE